MSRALAIAVLLLFSSSALGDDKEPLALRVNRSIDLGAASLVRRQAEDGSWRKDDKVHPLGRTALSIYTLLHAGYPKTHPAVRKGLGSLGLSLGYGSTIEPHSTYEAARKASAAEWPIPPSSSVATSSTPAAVATASRA